MPTVVREASANLLELVELGYSVVQIAASTGLTRYRAEVSIDLIGDRARRSGYDVPDASNRKSA